LVEKYFQSKIYQEKIDHQSKT